MEVDYLGLVYCINVFNNIFNVTYHIIHCQCLPNYHRHSREKERNVLFNDALNTFYLRLYGVRSDIARPSGTMRAPKSMVSSLVFLFFSLFWGVHFGWGPHDPRGSWTLSTLSSCLLHPANIIIYYTLI